jgi:hypothetical protein
MSQNADAVSNQGEFAGHVAPSEPLQKSGVSITFPRVYKEEQFALALSAL